MLSLASVQLRYDASSVQFMVVVAKTLVLLIGLAICFLQRLRKPKVSRWLIAILLAELFIVGVGGLTESVATSSLITRIVSLLGVTTVSVTELDRLLSSAGALISNVLFAAVWGTTFWVVLHLDGSQSSTLDPPSADRIDGGSGV